MDGTQAGPGGYAAVGALLIAAIVLPIDYAVRSSKARARQKGKLAAIFGGDEKLLFARILHESNPTSEKLTSMVASFQEAQSGNEDALIDLSKVTLIAGQEQIFLERAANSGSAEAQYRVSSLVTEYAQKISWLRKAAAQGHTDAQTDLVWLTKAAEAGNSEAQSELAKLSSFETKLARAEGGDVKSQLELAERYRSGRNVPRDLAQAIRWYVRAAVSGDDFAPYALGNIYADGEAGVVNPSHAYMWYSIAARVSSDDSEELDQRKRELTDIMSPDKIAEAERLARDWLEKHRK